MAIGATAVWEVRTTGADANAGFYTSGGTDYSQQDAAQLSLADVVTNGTTTVTSVTGGFTAAMIGNGINIAGTIYQITARTDTNTVTIDRTATTGSGQTGKVGGALLSPGVAAAAAVSGNKIWVATGSYSITSTSSNVAGGVITIGTNVDVFGYSGTRATRGTVTLLASGIATATILTLSGGTYVIVRDILVDGANLTAITGITISGGSVRGYLLNSRTTRCVTTGLNLTASQAQVLTDLEIDNCGNGMIYSPASTGGGMLLNTIYFHNNTTALDIGGAGFAACAGTNLIFSGNTTGVKCASNGIQFDGAVFYNNTTAISGATWINVAREAYLRNAVFYGNGTDITATGANGIGFVAFNNAAPAAFASTTFQINEGFVTLSANPFVNAGSGNFALNTTAGGGAACRAAGIPGVFPGGLTTGYPDIGGVQHADPAAAGALLANRGMDGGMI